MHTLLSWALPALLFIYALAAFVWPSWRIYKQTGVNPYALGNSDNTHDFIGKIFALVLGIYVAVIGIYVASPTLYIYLSPIPWLELPGVAYAGLAALLLSLLWIVAAQFSLGNSWRIGIDTQHFTELMRSGFYRFSRNPIFLGMRVSLLGFFLALPNAVTFAILVLGEVLIHVQVRLEEEFLQGMHGEAYAEFRRQTRRWL